MIDIKKEKFIADQPIPIPVEGMTKILNQMKKCICKIFKENDFKGTGFFYNIPFQSDYLPVLVTNNHILNENDIENGNIIKLNIYNKQKLIEIEIDNSRLKFTNQTIDITIIEIKPKQDGVEKDNYLEIEENDLNKSKGILECDYSKKSIYIIHYPKGKLNASIGLIDYIKDNKTIYHKCNTEGGSSGSPILSLETFKVIGIHSGSNKEEHQFNTGLFIKNAIDLFNIVKRNKKEINKKRNENAIKAKEMIECRYYYKINTEPNLGKIKDNINTNEYNSRFKQIYTKNKCNINIMKNKENIFSYNSNNNNNNNQIKSNQNL